MAGYRIERINEEIRRELASILRTIKDPRVPEMISLVAVKTTPDLKFCKVYVSFLDGVDEGAAMTGLKAAAGYIRREIGARLKLRNTPQFIFEHDTSIRYGAYISKVLKEVIPEEGEE